MPCLPWELCESISHYAGNIEWMNEWRKEGMNEYYMWMITLDSILIAYKELKICIL